MSKIILKEEISSPATPGIDKVILYPKSDGKIYSKDDLGVETQLSNSGGDVVGAAAVNDGALAAYNGTTGKLLKNTNTFYDATNMRLGINTTNPCSTLDIHGSMSQSCIVKTTNYIAANEYGILADATSTTITITLPLAAITEHRTYLIKKIDNTSNEVIIAASGSETIDGEPLQYLVSKNDAVTIVACNGGWYILSQINGIPHAQISSNISQQPVVTTPVTVILNQNDNIEGISHDTQTLPERIKINKKSKYFIMAAGQVGKTIATADVYVDLWLRINGVDVPNSNTRINIPTLTSTGVLVAQTIAAMNKNDYFQVMMSVSNATSGAGLIAATPAGEPAVPSIIVSVYEV